MAIIQFTNKNGHGNFAHPSIYSVQINTSPAVTKMFIRAIGSRNFQEKAIIWSIRTRIRVERIHRMKMNTANILKPNQSQTGKNGPVG